MKIGRVEINLICGLCGKNNCHKGEEKCINGLNYRKGFRMMLLSIPILLISCIEDLSYLTTLFIEIFGFGLLVLGSGLLFISQKKALDLGKSFGFEEEKI